MRFRIYYGGGATYSGDPFLAPPVNVQVVAQEGDGPGGRILMHGRDFYIWREFGWTISDQAGFWDYLMLYHGPKAVLFGRTIRDEDFQETLKRAIREGIAP